MKIEQKEASSTRGAIAYQGGSSRRPRLPQAKDVRLTEGRLTWSMVIMGLALLTGYVAANHLDSVVLANKVFPVVLLLGCFWGGFHLLRGPLEVWGPLPWCLLATGLYYGLGAVAPYFASEASVSYMQSHFQTTDQMLWRTNVLNVVGLVGILIGYSATRQPLARWATRWRFAKRPTRFWLKVFCMIGLPIKYLLFLPDAFGIWSFPIPSSILVLGTLSTVVVIVLAKEIANGQWRLLPWFLALFAAELVGGVLVFSKLELVWTCLAPVLGVFMARKTSASLLVGLAALWLLYVFVIPLVNFGREATRETRTADARARAVSDYFGGGFDDPGRGNDGSQPWWTRLCYSPVQAFVMAEYDEGRPGGTFDVLTYALVPRFLWPNKPIVTQGDRLTYLISGSTTSMNSPTVIGECYWAGGWWLVAAGSLWVGLLFQGLRTLAIQEMSGDNVGILPIALIGIRMGLRPDDYFVTMCVVSLGIISFLYVLLLLLSKFGRDGVRFGRPGQRRQDRRASAP